MPFQPNPGAIGLAARGYSDVPMDLAVHTPHPFLEIDWTSHAFTSPTNPTRITIPRGRGGVYSISAAVRWFRTDSNEFTLADSQSSYFYAWIMKNGSGNPIGNPLRSTTSATAFATGTTQSFTWLLDLDARDYLELVLQQGVHPMIAANGGVCLFRVGR